MNIGGDVRCYVLDNHRPVHLANIRSRYNVVVFNDESIEKDGLPSDGSDLSDPDNLDDEDEDDVKQNVRCISVVLQVKFV